MKELFSQAGTVESAVVIMDKETHRSKGFAFVEMSSEEEAKKAIEMFNGSELEGRTIVVNEADLEKILIDLRGLKYIKGSYDTASLFS